MELTDLVVSLGLGKELLKLDVNQDSLYSYFQYDQWNVVIRETKEILSPYSQADIDNLICAAPTATELGKELPSSVEFGNKRYYLAMTRTEKGRWFNLSDYWVGYEDIFGKCYLCSERDDNEANARAKMKIYLLKMIQIK